MDKRIALIVGATGTLGKAITNNLISKNIQLILVAKNTDRLEKLYDDIKNKALLSPKIIPLDLNHSRSIDLHGHTLENANEIISNFISKCHLNNINKIKVITGKGSRSKNKDDPYLSTDLSILKYSVPDYIKNNFEIMKKIKKLDLDSVNDVNKGSFDIILKKKL